MAPTVWKPVRSNAIRKRYPAGGVMPSPRVLKSIVAQCEAVIAADKGMKAKNGHAGKREKTSELSGKKNVSKRRNGIQDQLDTLGKFSSKLPVRNQLGRGTCTAFAVSACAEIVHANHTSEVVQFSPEFLYYHMRETFGLDRAQGWPDHYIDGGTKLSQAKQVLEKIGLCTELTAPYLRPDSNGVETHRPATEAEEEAREFSFAINHYWDQEDETVDELDPAALIHRELRQGYPCAAAFVMHKIGSRDEDNWRHDRVVGAGIVMGPEEGHNKGLMFEPVSGHVVCITGFQPDKSADGGGWFILRNSWWHHFGRPTLATDRLPRIPYTGYGAVSWGHVQRHCWELMSIRMAEEET